MISFPTDYSSIIERIENVDPIRYGKTRNFIDGDVTYLSPYISRGVISVKQVKEIVMQKGYKPYQTEKFLQELAWREYFQRVWQSRGTAAINVALKQEQIDVQHEKMISSVANATTGIEAIDEQINKLYETGYMHNHARMYTASIVCNIGKAHWHKPGKWMYYHLLDGDLASNNCSWQWVSAVFSSKKYYCNQENINKYCNSHQVSTFLDKSYEELPEMNIPDALQQTVELSLQTVLPKADTVNIDPSKPVLIYNSYNLDPNWRKEEDANRILLLEPSHFASYPVSEKVLEFILDLSKNIEAVQLFVGEFNELLQLTGDAVIISKEQPAFEHYTGTKDSRDWMFPQVTGYFNSFFSFWKKCERYL
ncbi:FAD-binding domain-containing protein [Lacibacter sediminis]|uniref:Deoxyribodipyrimidine photolyase n=1 Tax=Lacibacter sediminis TaxID=2760713 RepID=A0A7G5XBW4_9BACT|nr:FAD-binding domain-containing protein [Lacibacter sediminis]QNA42967.1 deoxyribodipyrimidine photolyase [Lacibacter sediminis]